VTTSTATERRALALCVNTTNPFAAMFLGAARQPIERVLYLKQIRALYSKVSGPLSGREFLERTLETLRIKTSIRPGDLERIPAAGPAVLVSNHPFGIVDPMVILSAVLSVRPDVKVMGNQLLSRIPELGDILIPVNPFGGNLATRDNTQAVRRCLHILREGQMLCMFPSGTVSHLHVRPGPPRIIDPPWNPMAARLACKTLALSVPAYVAGRNSLLFQMAGLIHPMLRTALLPRETVKKLGMSIQVRIGGPVSAERLQRIPDNEGRIGFLRSRTYLLAEEPENVQRSFPGRPRTPKLMPLNRPQAPERLARDIRALPAEQVLAENETFQVLRAEARQIPTMLEEIARLREQAFRREGGGTGKSMDMDRFDLHYQQLILWNREKQEVAGGYRMGLSRQILPVFGPRGFYTSTLFHYDRRFLDRIGPAIELGRSFVKEEYQKNYQPLFLLWKGIARFVSLNPDYRYLFGPVSITRAYQGRSLQIMVAFLRENRKFSELARLIRPRRPYMKRGLKSVEVSSAVKTLQHIRDLSDLISEIEEDRKGVPVLIRQYMRLGGEVLGFNVDPDFRDALDALILVDLGHTDQKILARYMGKEASEDFLRTHTAREMVRANG
jgi:putative hemolysin